MSPGRGVEKKKNETEQGKFLGKIKGMWKNLFE